MLHQIPRAVEVGSWWGSRRERIGGQLRSRQYEADVVPVDANGRVLALGSCKWSASEHDAGELDKLQTVATLVQAPDAPLYFFDRTGFSPRLVQISRERSNVTLVMADELDSV